MEIVVKEERNQVVDGEGSERKEDGTGWGYVSVGGRKKSLERSTTRN